MEQFQKDDIEKNKLWAGLGYIFFLIPTLAANDSPYAKYHANQGLIINIAELIVWIVGWIVPFIGGIIAKIASIAIIILIIIGIINVANGEAKPLPFIGEITILK